MQTDSNASMGTVGLYSAFRLWKQFSALIQASKLLKHDQWNSVMTIFI